MWFRFLIFRLLVLAFFCALPFLVWPPAVWLAVFCLVMALGIAAFGLVDPKSRFARLIVTMVVAFLPLLGSAVLPNFTEEMIPDAAWRDWANFILEWLTGGGTGTTVLVIYIVVLLTLVGLEIFRLWLEAKNDTAPLKLRPIITSGLWGFDPVKNVYWLEMRVALENQTSEDIEVTTAHISLLGISELEGKLAPNGEVTMVLNPREVIQVPAQGEPTPYIRANLPASGLGGVLLSGLNNWVGRYLVPLPVHLSIRSCKVWVNLRAAPKPERTTLK